MAFAELSAGLAALPLSAQLGLVAALLVAALWLGWVGRRFWRSLTVRRRARQAGRGERIARTLLRSAGYRIVGDQVRCQWPIAIDGQPSSIELRVDYLVERGGRRFVADAKTGSWASSLNNGATRRQLLEYWLAYHTDGAILIDTERGLVREISFPALQ